MKRLIPLLALAVTLLVIAPATAADSFILTVVSQTNNTITFSYPQQPGFGYIYSANGVVVSRTYDATRTQIRFSKANSYEVAAIVKGGTGSYPNTPPPPLSQCQDGIDNDGDRKVDFPSDPGCSALTDNDETDPAPPQNEAITSAQCTARAVAGATIQNVTVSGGCTIRAANVTLRNATLTGVVSIQANATGFKLLNSKAKGFDVLSADNVLIEGNEFDGQHSRDQNFIWDDPAGNVPQNITIRNNTLHGFCCSGAHEEALYVGYSDTGLIEGNTFYDNAMNNGTAHIFFTYCGQLSANQSGCATDQGTDPRNWCVQGNVFQDTHSTSGSKYYSVNFREEIPANVNIRVNPNQQSQLPLIGPTQTQAQRFGMSC